MTARTTIDDRMVAFFRRTGKRRASFRPALAGPVAAPAAQPVALQRSGGCRHVHDLCRGPNGAIGVCDNHLDCVMPFSDGFELPHR